MNWTTAENAIHNWLQLATGIAADRILWARQGVTRPAGTSAWISLKRIAAPVIGQDWSTHALNPTPTAGNELLHTAAGNRAWTISIQCYGGTATEATSPEAILDDALLKLALPAYKARFTAAEIGVGEISGPRPLDGLLNSVAVEPRAQVDVTFLLAASVTATGPALETVGVTGYVPNEADPDEVLTLALDATP